MKAYFLTFLYLSLITPSLFASSDTKIKEEPQKKSKKEHKEHTEKAELVPKQLPPIKIEEFEKFKLAAFLEPIDELKKKLIAMGTHYGIKDWPARFKLFEKRIALMQPFLVNELKKTKPYYGIQNDTYILVLLGLKPIESYCYSFVHNFELFNKNLFSLFKHDQRFIMIPLEGVDIPKKDSEFLLTYEKKERFEKNYKRYFKKKYEIHMKNHLY